MNSSEDIPLAIEVKYYKPYFETEEITILQDELSNLGHLRSRGFFKDLGGEETNLWIILQWIGITVSGGIIQHIASKHYEKILDAINKYRKRTTEKGIEFEQFVKVVFSYDDLDINITLPNETKIELFHDLFKKINDRFSEEPLKSKKITELFVPYFF